MRPLVVRYRLRDGVVDSRGNICSTLELTLDGWWMVDFVFMRVHRIRIMSRCIIRSWDSGFLCVVWQEQGKFPCGGYTPDTWDPARGYIQGLEMRARWVLADSSAMQQRPLRRGSYELLVCLGYLGTRLAGGSLPFVMNRVMVEGDLVHFRFDTWGITETSTTWRGRLILLWLRVEIGNGGVDISIMGMPQ